MTTSSDKKKRKKSKDLTKTNKEQKTTSNSPATTDHPQRDRNNNQVSASLASRLKRLRGTAATTTLPPEWSGVSSSKSNTTSTEKFLTPDDGDRFESCVKECYRGFTYDKPGDLSSEFHDKFSYSFNALNDSGLFLYDVVQPGGKKLSQTFVTRTLVGEPGSTYKYLGLRLFSHPWCDVDEDGDGEVVGSLHETQKSYGQTLLDLGYSKKCTKALCLTGLLNKDLSLRTNTILEKEIVPMVKDGLVGSADYSLTLINRMEPTTVKKDLKNDKIHGIGKTSVSWHKDSGLADFSSIAVYHHLEESTNIDERGSPWRVALRVADATTRTPALSIPLPSGTVYYLLDDFNHQHEHAVISGSSSLRYSSTHRVARAGAGTLQYIRDKCRKVLSCNVCKEVLLANDGGAVPSFETCSNAVQKKQLVKEVQACHQLMTELEFEWIRQWYIQGRTHAKLHPYWKKPIILFEKYYLQLDTAVGYINSLLKSANSDIVNEDLFDVSIEAIENRLKLRREWEQRLKDSIFKTLDKEDRPFKCEMLEDICTINASEVRDWRSAFVGKGSDQFSSDDKQRANKKRKSKDKDKSAGLTKKEKKRVASNWEKMKKKMK